MIHGLNQDAVRGGMHFAPDAASYSNATTMHSGFLPEHLIDHEYAIQKSRVSVLPGISLTV